MTERDYKMNRENLKAYLEKQIADIKHYLKINGRKEDEDGFSPSEDLQICNIAKNTIDLEEQLGCPLEVYVKINQRNIVNVYDVRGDNYIIKPDTFTKDSFLAVDCFKLIECMWNMYCKTWWLKKDKSE